MKTTSTKIRYSTLLLSMMCLLLIASPYIPQRVNNIIKLLIEISLVMLTILKYKFDKNTVRKMLPISLFFMAICVCTFRIYGLESRSFNAIVTGGTYFVFFFLIRFFSARYNCMYVSNVIRTNILLYMLILDLLVILTWGKGLGGLDEAVYLIGNKFMTSYLHMLILALINVNRSSLSKWKKTIRILLFLLYSLFICVIADTSTGLFGCLTVATVSIIIMWWPLIIQIMSKPYVVIVFFIGLNAVFLLSDFILNNTAFEYFFMARSHTSTILSGRVLMYQISMDAIVQSPIWGYGINYDIVQKTLSFGNPQNGILKLLLDYGIVGTVLFCIVLFTTFKNSRFSQYKDLKEAYIIFVYGMLLCSLVEINLAAIFILACAALNSTEGE